MVPPAPAHVDAVPDWLRKHFDAEAARGLQAVVQIELTGPGGGVLALQVDDGRLQVRCAEAERPDVVLRLSAEDGLALFAGRENADLLHMAGRLEIEGDLSRASKLRTLFRAPG